MLRRSQPVHCRSALLQADRAALIGAPRPRARRRGAGQSLRAVAMAGRFRSRRVRRGRVPGWSGGITAQEPQSRHIGGEAVFAVGGRSSRSLAPRAGRAGNSRRSPEVTMRSPALISSGGLEEFEDRKVCVFRPIHERLLPGRLDRHRHATVGVRQQQNAGCPVAHTRDPADDRPDRP